MTARDIKLIIGTFLVSLVANVFYFFYDPLGIAIFNYARVKQLLIGGSSWLVTAFILGFLTYLISLIFVPKKVQDDFESDSVLDYSAPIRKNKNRRTFLFSFIWMVIIQLSYVIPHSTNPESSDFNQAQNPSETIEETSEDIVN